MAPRNKLRHGRPIIFENDHVRIIGDLDGSVTIEEATSSIQSGAAIVFGKKFGGGGLTFTLATHSNIKPIIDKGTIAWFVSQ